MFERLMGLKSISPRDLNQMVESGEATVIDVNSRNSWEAAHVPGALTLDALNFEAKDLPADRDSALVFYCSNFLCRKAPNAARRAKEMGYRNVYVMSAGISGWQSASLPTESGPRAASPSAETATRG